MGPGGPDSSGQSRGRTHVIAFLIPPEGQRGRGGLGRAGLDAIAGTAPGEQPTMLPDGIGKLVKAGSMIVLLCTTRPTALRRKIGPP